MDHKKDCTSTVSILQCRNGAVSVGNYLKGINHMGDLIKAGNIILK
jgi:hypothetical protein